MTDSAADDEASAAARLKPGLSQASVRLLRRLRLSCAVSAMGFLLPLAAILVVQALQGPTSHDGQRATQLCALIGIAGVLTVLGAKALCLGSAAEIGDPKFVHSAFVLDLAALGSLGMYAWGFYEWASSLICAACLLLSTLMFTKYLGEVAVAIGRPKLVSSARRVVIGITFTILLGIATAVAILSAGRAEDVLSYVFPVLALAIFGVTSTFASVTFMLYVALLAAFAIAKFAAPPDAAA